MFFSGTIGEEAAIESLKRGAVDYVLKDKPARLVSAIRRALQDAAEQSDRRRQEQQLKHQAALLDLAQDAIIVTEIEGAVTYWNRAAERLHGWRSDEALGRCTKEFLYSDLSWFADAAKILRERGEWIGDVNKRTKSGGELLMHTHWTLVRDAVGKPELVLSISTDITEKRKLEEQLLRAQRVECIGALAGGIAHDLNNIFSPILVAGQMLGQNLREEDRKKAAEMITGCAKRGAEMVAHILAFARGTGGLKQRLHIEASIFEIGKLLQNILPSSIHLNIKVVPALQPVLGNPTQLHQVLMNLCINARDAMPRGGDLILSAQSSTFASYRTSWELEPISGPFVSISVSDSGHGMPQELLGKVFEPFFTTKGPERGTGLGLATVRGIVRNHGGFVEVFSEVGRGTTFHVHLPVLREDV